MTKTKTTKRTSRAKPKTKTKSSKRPAPKPKAEAQRLHFSLSADAVADLEWIESKSRHMSRSHITRAALRCLRACMTKKIASDSGELMIEIKN